jgi:hypothetical protein
MPLYPPYDQCICELKLALAHVHFFDFIFCQTLYCELGWVQGIVRFRGLKLRLPFRQRRSYSPHQDLQWIFPRSLNLGGDYQTDIAQQFFRRASFLYRFFDDYPLGRADYLKIHSFSLRLRHKVCAARSGQFQSFAFFTQSECVNCSVVLFSQGIISLLSKNLVNFDRVLFKSDRGLVGLCDHPVLTDVNLKRFLCWLEVKNWDILRADFDIGKVEFMLMYRAHCLRASISVSF